MQEQMGQDQISQDQKLEAKPKKKIFSLAITFIVILIILVLVLDGALFYLFYQSGQFATGPVDFVIDEYEKQSQPIIELAVAKRLLSDTAKYEKLEINPQIVSYQLPLAMSQIDNYDEVSQKIGLNQQAQQLLAKNGFAVIETPDNFNYAKDDFADYYVDVKDKDLPVFISSDSLLHYYHIFFDTTLMKLEQDVFYDDIWQISKQLLTDSTQDYLNTEGDLKEAAKRNMAYLSVAMELLKPKADQVSSDATLRQEYCEEGMAEDVCQMFLTGVKETYGDKTSYKYFSEADVKNYDFDIPVDVADLVSQELALIDATKGWEKSPTFIYQEDYSQYVARGHYTKSEKLKNYFKALMWYGRMTALINGDQNLEIGESECNGAYTGIVSDYDAKVQTLQASMIAQNFLTNKELQDLWQRVYAITSFFVGFSDDLGPYEYGQVLSQVIGDEISLSELDIKYPEIQKSLTENTIGPQIYSGLGKCQMLMPCPPLSDNDLAELKVQANTLLGQTKGFRLMGQRFVSDSYFFSQIVSPYSGQYLNESDPLPTDDKPFTFSWDDEYNSEQETRPFSWVKTDVVGCESGREVKGFPRGLDLMAAFGSERAWDILEKENDTAYSDYQTKLNEFKTDFAEMNDSEWTKNLYMGWLFTLQGLFEDYGEGYQSFMQTDAWQDKQLNTALASWSELRHDTLLYVKQSYTIAEMGGIVIPEVAGYVEPVPEFYNRLLYLTNLTKDGLQKLLPETKQKTGVGVVDNLENFAEIIQRLIDISQKELANEALTENDYDFIAQFGETSKHLIESVAGADVDPKVLKSVMVADVHTDGNTEKVIEEGVGYIKTLLVAYKLPDDRILLGVGPAFSYYEFKQDMDKRLTDEAWRAMLESGNYPDQPVWTKNFSQ